MLISQISLCPVQRHLGDSICRGPR